MCKLCKIQFWIHFSAFAVDERKQEFLKLKTWKREENECYMNEEQTKNDGKTEQMNKLFLNIENLYWNLQDLLEIREKLKQNNENKILCYIFWRI